MKELKAVGIWACLVFCPPAMAGFSIDGAPAVSTERSPMGSYQPYEARGQATFRASSAEMTPKQARYHDAELMVDLAYRPVTQIGSGQASLVDGFADDVPFTTAVTMIMPAGWQLYRSNELKKTDVPERVSYLGGKPWPDVMEAMAKRYALSFQIDWYQKTVMMGKGRQTSASQIARVKVIPEPKPIPSVSTNVLSAKSPGAQSSTAVAIAASPDKPISVAPGGSASGSKISNLPAQASKNFPPQSVPATVSTTPAIAAAPPVKTAGLTIDVLPGTLKGNVIRLSQLNGWNPPEWKITGDYKIRTGYSLHGSGFEEVMVKLLLSHPVEADVNTAMKKIIVLNEVKETGN